MRLAESLKYLQSDCRLHLRMIFYANPSRYCHSSARNELVIVLRLLARRGICCSLVQEKADSPRRKPDYGVSYNVAAFSWLTRRVPQSYVLPYSPQLLNTGVQTCIADGCRLAHA